MELPRAGGHCLGIVSQDTPAVLLTLHKLRVVSWFGIHQPSDAHKFVQMMKLKRLRRKQKRKCISSSLSRLSATATTAPRTRTPIVWG